MKANHSSAFSESGCSSKDGRQYSVQSTPSSSPKSVSDSLRAWILWGRGGGGGVTRE